MPRHYNRKSTTKKKKPPKMLLEDRFPTPGRGRAAVGKMDKPKTITPRRKRRFPMSEDERWLRSRLPGQRNRTTNESFQLEGQLRGLSPIRTPQGAFNKAAKTEDALFKRLGLSQRFNRRR